MAKGASASIYPVHDCNILAVAPTTVFNTSLALLGSGSLQARYIVGIDLAAQMDATNLYIVSASLRLVTASFTSAGTLNIHPMTRGFDESQATWNVSSAGNPWSSDGGDYTTETKASASITDGGTYNIDVTSVVRACMLGNLHNVWMMVKWDDDTSGSESVQLHTSEAVSEANMPLLTVQWFTDEWYETKPGPLSVNVFGFA